MVPVIQAVIAFLYVVVAVAVLYRVVSQWLADGAEFNAMHQIANALNALVVFAALMILHAVAAAYGVAPPLHVP